MMEVLPVVVAWVRCWLGFHDWMPERVDVTETTRCLRLTCLNCRRETPGIVVQRGSGPARV